MTEIVLVYRPPVRKFSEALDVGNLAEVPIVVDHNLVVLGEVDVEFY
jgi:hypothetical protein